MVAAVGERVDAAAQVIQAEEAAAEAVEEVVEAEDQEVRLARGRKRKPSWIWQNMSTSGSGLNSPEGEKVSLLL